MPDVAWNKVIWEKDYNWSGLGEEWSAAWGSSEAQWHGCILPRVRNFLPAANVLEIAPGHGRWTRFLVSLSSAYAGVDLSATCVEHCRAAFAGASASFFVNDGADLAMIEDGSIDFIFSFDSLVHAEKDIFEAYVPQMLRKCRAGGVVFIHHSNRRAVDVPVDPHNRATSVDASVVADIVRRAGGAILRQEIICWGETESLDCLTLFACQGDFAADGEIVHNNDFMKEAYYIRAHIAPWSFARKNG